MRFTRYPRIRTVEATPQRVAAAKRAVERDRERCGLFPEMMQFKTAGERVAAIIKGRDEWWQERRDHTAMEWRTVRRRLRSMTATKQAAIKRYWQRGVYPGSPVYLAGMITDAERGRCWWHALADLRRLELIGAGRLAAPWKISRH